MFEPARNRYMLNEDPPHDEARQPGRHRNEVRPQPPGMEQVPAGMLVLWQRGIPSARSKGLQ
jgi:hypothetical protein